MSMNILAYVFIINVLAFFIFCNDKHRAVYGKRRVPELVLFFLALAGGSFGACMSMLMFRHKTGKKLFKIGMPVMLALLCIILFLLGYPLDILPDICI